MARVVAHARAGSDARAKRSLAAGDPSGPDVAGHQAGGKNQGAPDKSRLWALLEMNDSAGWFVTTVRRSATIFDGAFIR
jgi:hypothetical protein